MPTRKRTHVDSDAEHNGSINDKRAKSTISPKEQLARLKRCIERWGRLESVWADICREYWLQTEPATLKMWAARLYDPNHPSRPNHPSLKWEIVCFGRKKKLISDEEGKQLQKQVGDESIRAISPSDSAHFLTQSLRPLDISDEDEILPTSNIPSASTSQSARHKQQIEAVQSRSNTCSSHLPADRIKAIRPKGFAPHLRENIQEKIKLIPHIKQSHSGPSKTPFETQEETISAELEFINQQDIKKKEDRIFNLYIAKIYTEIDGKVSDVPLLELDFAKYRHVFLQGTVSNLQTQPSLDPPLGRNRQATPITFIPQEILALRPFVNTQEEDSVFSFILETKHAFYHIDLSPNIDCKSAQRVLSLFALAKSCGIKGLDPAIDGRRVREDATRVSQELIACINLLASPLTFTSHLSNLRPLTFEELNASKPLLAKESLAQEPYIDYLQRRLFPTKFVSPIVYWHLQDFVNNLTFSPIFTSDDYQSKTKNLKKRKQKSSVLMEAIKEQVRDFKCFSSSKRKGKLNGQIENHFSPEMLCIGNQIVSDLDLIIKRSVVKTSCSATIDGIQYKVGDNVLLNGNKTVKGVVIDDSVPWIAKIKYFFQHENNEVFMHVQYYNLAEHTFLRTKTLASQLFITKMCDSQPISLLVNKVNVTELDVNQVIPLDPDGFYVSHAYILEDCSFVDASDLEKIKDPFKDSLFRQLDILPDCVGCHYRLEKVVEDIPFKLNDTTFFLNSQEYHLHDFVLMLPENKTTAGDDENSHFPKYEKKFKSKSPPYRIAQITNIKQVITKDRLTWNIMYEGTPFNIQVLPCIRLGPERLISMTSKKINVQSEDIMRPVKVITHAKLLESFTTQTDVNLIQNGITMHDIALQRLKCAYLESFYLSDTNKNNATRPFCKICAGREIEQQRKQDELLKASKRLNKRMSSLELYAGTGGLAAGLHWGCEIIKPTIAIESNLAAAKSLAVNLKGCAVITTPVDQWIESRLTAREWSDTTDMIAGGPPCQGFSYANMYKTGALDPRCYEPFVWLSAIESERPLFAVFENVRHILEFQMPGEANAQSKSGLVDQMVSILLMLGYQVRLGVLAAAAYGAPQRRYRLFILASLRGVTLPQFPLPTHTADLTCTYFNNVTGDDESHTTPSNPFPKEGSGCGVYIGRTVGELSTDLGAFEVPDPDRAGLAIGTANTVKEYPFSPVSYTSGCLNSLQQEMRIHAFRDGTIQVTNAATGQCIPPYSSIVSARIRRLEVGQNYTNLPESIRPTIPYWIKDDPKKQAQFWGKLTENDMLSTLRTTLPVDGASHGPRLHPTQKRPLSVRELARASGLPDSMSFLDDLNKNEDPDVNHVIKLIGNAVPALYLAEPIGKEIYKIAIQLLNAPGWDQATSFLQIARDRARKYRDSGGGLY